MLEHTMEIQMELSRIFIRELEDLQIIELTEVEGKRCFPIVVGIHEAFAIERRLKGVPVPRPQTHELLENLLESLGGHLQKILIHELSEGTFYAMLCIQQGDRDIQVDARPSDAIALGVASNVPIVVTENVLRQVEKEDLLPPGFGSLPDDVQEPE
tara:strand:+ start:6975 stop:7442 length:468 start_codon:yes stop_codon:yes gene_type:complete